MFAHLLKIDIFHDEEGEFAKYNHVTRIKPETIKLLAARFPRDVGQAPAFNQFLHILEGKVFDLRMVPDGLHTSLNSHVESEHGFFIGRDKLEYAPDFLQHATVESVAKSFADYAYQNIVCRQSHRYHAEMLHADVLKADKHDAEKECESQNNENITLRNVFNKMFTKVLVGTNPHEAHALMTQYPQTSILMKKLMGGAYFAKTA